MFMESMLLKLAKLREAGIDAYPPRVPKPTHKAAQVRTGFESLGDTEVTVAGRITATRGHGKAMFLSMADDSGQVQLYTKIDVLGEQKYTLLQEALDIGDQVVAKGPVFKTRTGEVTVECKEFIFASKALEGLPEKWHGLKDPDIRYRKRYLDMIANPEVRERLEARTRIIRAMREFLWGLDFLEVETPTLQPLYGGALAKPFVTHHNALDMDLYLRIAPELYLKRLIVGGMARIFEIAKCFRNEGISQVHNPEFTMLELYQAWGDYNDMMDITEKLVSHVAKSVTGRTTVTYQGQEINLAPPWKRLTMRQAFKDFVGIDIDELRDERRAFQIFQEKGIEMEKKPAFGAFCDEVLKKVVETNIVQPTFVYDYPLELSPLAKMKPGEPGWVERFQPIVAGFEIGNAFTELNDPQDQLDRFNAQAGAKTLGDEEAHQTDTDFVDALAVGMPPTGGLGIGVDRLVMLLTDQVSIREVLAFPQLRRTGGDIS